MYSDIRVNLSFSPMCSPRVFLPVVSDVKNHPQNTGSNQHLKFKTGQFQILKLTRLNISKHNKKLEDLV